MQLTVHGNVNVCMECSSLKRKRRWPEAGREPQRTDSVYLPCTHLFVTRGASLWLAGGCSARMHLRDDNRRRHGNNRKRARGAREVVWHRGDCGVEGKGRGNGQSRPRAVCSSRWFG